MKAVLSSIPGALLCALLCLSYNSNAQLIVNEVSQGPSGSKEWVELLTIGTPSCDSTCVDLRGWILDDNSGFFAAGSGTGIADGHMRFASDPQWACVGYGAIIVIYNNSDPDPALPADDPTDANGDCVYVIPASSNLFDRDESAPSVNGSSGYVGATYTAGGSWSTVQMNNSYDSYQTVSPNDISQPYFAVSWGNNNSGNIIYMSGSSGGQTIYMDNNISNDPFDQGNWVKASVGSDQTPGLPNNTANANWIATLNNNCTPYSPPQLFVSNDTSICGGSTVILEASTDISGVQAQFTWSTGETGPVISVNPIADTIYYVTMEVLGCVIQDSVSITIDAQIDFDLGNDASICIGNSLEIAAPVSGNYSWSNGSSDSVITVQPNQLTTYSLTISQNNCTGADSIEVSVQNPPVITVSNDTTICEGNGVVLQANGATSYNWSNNQTGASISVMPANSTTYYLTASEGACSVLDSVDVNVWPNNLSADIEILNESCVGAENGQISLSQILGAPATIELLDNQGNTVTAGTDSVFNGLTAGTYTIQLVNDNGCSVLYDQLEIGEDSIEFSMEVFNPDCSGGNGSVLVETEIDNLVSFDGGAFENNFSYENLSAGNYTVAVRDSNGCKAEQNIALSTPDPLIIEMSPDSVNGFPGETATLSVDINGGTAPFTWNWDENFQLDCYDCFESILTLENSGWLDLNIEDAAACLAVDSVYVNVEEELVYGIPNAFTPNSDGQNDSFEVIANVPLDNFVMRIFNRWGQKVFESRNSRNGWNGYYKGTLQPVGTYVYVIRFDEYRNGSLRQTIQEGSLTLIR